MRGPQSTYRVAMAGLWRIFRHDGKISPGWYSIRVGGARPPSFTLVTITYKFAAPAERAVTLPLFHLYLYMYSVYQYLYNLYMWESMGIV
jgi:hypothetical protein